MYIRFGMESVCIKRVSQSMCIFDIKIYIKRKVLLWTHLLENLSKTYKLYQQRNFHEGNIVLL